MFFSLSKALKALFFTLCLSSFLISLCSAEMIKFGSWSESSLAELISAAQQIDSPGDVIVALSAQFKNTSYAENTLKGSPDDPEELVINFSEFDCFTFLDVIEALRRSARYEDFTGNLKIVRYIDGTVTYQKRRHFFSDWLVGDVPIEDITARVGKGRAQSVNKQLNLKADGSHWLAGIGVTPRVVYYLPTGSVDEEVLSALRPGDYVGIFSSLEGLDVSHTGVIVKDNAQVLLRHASSRSETGRVVDEVLLQYLKGKPGLVVYRVKP